MKADNESRRLVTRSLGVVGAIAGTTAVVASGTSTAVASTQPRHPDGVSGGITTNIPVGSTTSSGTYESCTAMFGLAHKNDASWVKFDVHANQPLTPAVTIGPELRAIVTVHGAPSDADVECAADVPTWTNDAEWLEFVRVQRNLPDLSTITGHYPYPGGPGYAIPIKDQTYTATPSLNELTADITVSGASVRFETDSTRFSVVAGSPQELKNLSPTEGSNAALAAIMAIDPSYSATLAACQNDPSSTDDAAITAAVTALGTVWGIDVDEMYPPASSSLADRCTAFDNAGSSFYFTMSRLLTVGTTATVTVEPPPTTATATTSTTAPPTPAVAADVVAPTFTG